MYDLETLSRIQFALTTIYHWLFVPVTLGMTCLVAVMEFTYVNTKNEIYRKMAKFWGGLFLINFALGVATGIVQEFQFGMNWSEYSRFMGDIFGAPLALEALTAFFMESTFMGAWIFGWDRLSPKAHAWVAFFVALGSNISAFWILVANSFMQHPVGYVLENGRAQLHNFAELLGNTSAHFQFAHIFTDGILFGGTILVAISAWQLLRKKDYEFYKRSMKWGAVAMVLGGVLVIGVGHLYGQYVARVQPMTIAASEALWKTADPAPFEVFAVVDQEKQENKYSISVPGVLSLLVHDSFNGEVKGMEDLNTEMQAIHGPGNYIPENVAVIFTAWRVMVYAGPLLALIGLFALWSARKDNLSDRKCTLKILGWSLVLPYFINASGWLVTEMGRQPWIVYGLQLTKDGVSKSITSGDVLFSIIGFTTIYGLAAVAAFYLAVRHIKKGPGAETSENVEEPKAKEATLWN